MSYTSLSKSKIWDIMGDYYSHIGPDAWIDGIVPSDISSNKYLASIYAELILGKLLDWKNEISESREKTLYIIEIGAGHGKFGFYILKLLEKFTQDSDSDLFKKIKYVITDISQKNLESWQNNPSLAHFTKLGILDFALFNAASDNQIQLINSKKIIRAQSLDTPIIAICNYLIDTLAHDAFRIKNNNLYEILVKIENKNKINDKDTEDSEAFFENLNFKFKDRAIASNYYENEHINKILTYYKEYFNEGSVLIPIGGMQCIENLEQFTTKHVVTLVADKGYHDLEEVEDLDDPEISLHGSVSLMVNFDSLERFFSSKGGFSLTMPNKWADFQVACFISKKVDSPKLKQAFFKNLSDFSPQDLFDLCYTEEDELNPGLNSINSIISLLNLCKWDPDIFSSVAHNLIETIEDDDTELLLQHEKILLRGIDKVWDYFYDFNSSKDLCFLIGLLYYVINHNKKSIEFFKLSLENFEESPETYYNLAIAYQDEEQIELAIDACEKALKLNPKYKDARQLLNSL